MPLVGIVICHPHVFDFVLCFFSVLVCILVQNFIKFSLYLCRRWYCVLHFTVNYAVKFILHNLSLNRSFKRLNHDDFIARMMDNLLLLLTGSCGLFF